MFVMFKTGLVLNCNKIHWMDEMKACVSNFLNIWTTFKTRNILLLLGPVQSLPIRGLKQNKTEFPVRCPYE